MILGIFLVAAAALAAFLIAVATRRGAFRVVRSAVIPAPEATLFAEVNDLHRWQAWSPWARLDPAAQNDFAGPPLGIGSSMHWTGNNKVGEGRMTIIETEPCSFVRLRLEFLKPFQAINLAEFTFEPRVEGTLVTWSMSGTNKFLGKLMGVFIDCDKMCGAMFEQGLANLEVVTREAAINAAR
jgi:hypothetical protein